MRTELRTAQERAGRLIGAVDRRRLGRVRADESIAFARACAEGDPRFLDAAHPAFAVHPMYLPSLLRGPFGARDTEYRDDGMFADEVPGTSGLDVRLMAGGQHIVFRNPPPLGEEIEVSRVIAEVERKGRPESPFLLITVVKSYRAAVAGELATVTERFIVR
ncbi:hypothetical protein [Amycolatopsis sp.]|jgi:hypothetical protein|uniref:hypothetical protein n=1 Tax=Amycolatopsis sp. TaxID=37632 RepID=UPI002DF7A83B|nr:hypothetical protein [Amycolatopsis sp.]